MPRVQSIFSYTLPAVGAYALVPPAAPLNCGCNDLILILKNRSLVLTALKGILRVEIKSVAVSVAPVQPIDGSVNKVWKYDYTVEYDTANLTDVNYRVRKCDIEYNCCYSCAMAFVDRQLLGYVKSVNGAGVNNADPQNPVLAGDTLVNNGNRSFTHTASNGTAVIFCQGIQVIASANDALGGVGANYMLRQAVLGAGVGDACTMTLNSAPEHTAIDGSFGGGLTLPALLVPASGSVITGPIPLQNTRTVANLTNRPMRLFVSQSASFSFDILGPTSECLYTMEMSVNGAAFSGQSVNRRGMTGMPVGSRFTIDEDITVPAIAVFTIPVGGSVDIQTRLRMQAVSGGIEPIGNQTSFVTYFGITL